MGAECIKQRPDASPCVFSGSFGGLSQQVLELGEHLLDRVQVGRVWRQVEQLGLGGTDGLADSWAFVAGEVVHDDDVARCEGGHEELLDPFDKTGPVDRLIEDTRCIDAVTAQSGDEGHGAPMAIGYLGVQPLALGCPAPQGCHVGLRPRLVNEDEVPGIKLSLILAPLRAPPCDLGAQLFGGKYAFF